MRGMREVDSPTVSEFDSPSMSESESPTVSGSDSQQSRPEKAEGCRLQRSRPFWETQQLRRRKGKYVVDVVDHGTPDVAPEKCPTRHMRLSHEQRSVALSSTSLSSE